MKAYKHLLTPLFAIFFQNIFAQQKFDITISFDSSIDTKKIKYNYDNGAGLHFTTDTFTNNTCRIKDKFYSKLVSFLIYYIDHNGHYCSNSFFIDNKPAKIHFTNIIDTNNNKLPYDTIINASPIFDTTNKIWKELAMYRKKEDQAVADLWKKHENDIGQNDSITLLNKKLFKSLHDRSISFLKKYPQDYFSFWFFRDQIIKSSIAFIKDTAYLKSLLASFKSIFPSIYINSIEGQNAIKQLEARINARIVKANELAPLFTLKDIRGRRVKLSNFKGKYVLLDFWASWCGPCRINNPILKKINDKYHKYNFELISISTDDDLNKWKAAINEDSMNWINLIDIKERRNSASTYQYGVEGIPTYFLIGPSGKIIMRNDNEIDKLEKEIKNIFSSQGDYNPKF